METASQVKRSPAVPRGAGRGVRSEGGAGLRGEPPGRQPQTRSGGGSSPRAGPERSRRAPLQTRSEFVLFSWRQVRSLQWGPATRWRGPRRPPRAEQVAPPLGWVRPRGPPTGLSAAGTSAGRGAPIPGTSLALPAAGGELSRGLFRPLLISPCPPLAAPQGAAHSVAGSKAGAAVRAELGLPRGPRSSSDPVRSALCALRGGTGGLATGAASRPSLGPPEPPPSPVF